MKAIKFYQSGDSTLKKMRAKKRGWKVPAIFRNVQEDYFFQSKEYPIFAVADGVTLIVEPGKVYPNPSGAGNVAKIFCRSAVKSAENIYHDFEKKNLRDIFERANVEVEKYNAECGRTKKLINYFDKDFFCATAAFALAKDSKLFWGAIGDSRIMLTDGKGEIKLLTRDQVAPIEKITATKIPNPKPQEKKYFQQKHYRNKIGANGKLVGYGVIDGEKEVLQYIEYGKTKIEKGDRLFVFTDGFMPYFEMPKFRKIFSKWPADLEKKVLKFTKDYAKKNLPADSESQYRFLYKYAAERSLLAIKF